jgi:hypothetical protein
VVEFSSGNDLCLFVIVGGSSSAPLLTTRGEETGVLSSLLGLCVIVFGLSFTGACSGKMDRKIDTKKVHTVHNNKTIAFMTLPAVSTGTFVSVMFGCLQDYKKEKVKQEVVSHHSTRFSN